MKASFYQIWDEFCDFRNIYLESLNFTDDRSKFILALWARINSLCEETIVLVKSDCFVSPQILMRSTLESFVDLRCLISDEDYVKNIMAAQADSMYKNLNKHSESNPYYKGITKANPKHIENLKEEKTNSINIFERFKKAGCEDLYSTVYNTLCRYTHGNISALASKNFENDRVVMTAKISDADLLFILSSTINVGISSTHDVLSFYNTSESVLVKCMDSHDKVKVLCRKFV
jgi:hypothetical protein